MKSLLENPETKLVWKIRNILLGVLATFIWINIAIQIHQYITSTPNKVYKVSPEDVLPFLLYGCLFAPLYEEVIFREAPLKIARSISKEAVVPTMIASSVIFGLMHGYGDRSVLYQGVMGLIFASVYLKNGFSYWSSVTTHALWNFLCLIHPL